jgi:hypothetical protein
MPDLTAIGLTSLSSLQNLCVHVCVMFCSFVLRLRVLLCIRGAFPSMGVTGLGSSLWFVAVVLRSCAFRVI